MTIALTFFIYRSDIFTYVFGCEDSVENVVHETWLLDKWVSWLEMP